MSNFEFFQLFGQKDRFQISIISISELSFYRQNSWKCHALFIGTTPRVPCMLREWNIWNISRLKFIVEKIAVCLITFLLLRMIDFNLYALFWYFDMNGIIMGNNRPSLDFFYPSCPIFIPLRPNLTPWIISTSVQLDCELKMLKMLYKSAILFPLLP